MNKFLRFYDGLFSCSCYRIWHILDLMKCFIKPIKHSCLSCHTMSYKLWPLSFISLSLHNLYELLKKWGLWLITGYHFKKNMLARSPQQDWTLRCRQCKLTHWVMITPQSSSANLRLVTRKMELSRHSTLCVSTRTNLLSMKASPR